MDAVLDAERAYLRRYPDVAGALKAGIVTSALDHFLNYGRFEGRAWLGPAPAGMEAALDAPGALAGALAGALPGAPLAGEAGSEAAARPDAAVSAEAPAVPHHCDAILLTQGFLFVEGWIDDRFDRLVRIELGPTGGPPALSAAPCRYRRQDVEEHLAAASPFEGGFWQLLEIPPEIAARPFGIRLVLASGHALSLNPGSPVRLSPREHLESFLGFYGRRQLIGSQVARSFAELDAGLAATIGHLHEAIRATRAVASEGSYGHRPARPLLSFICCIYGIPDFLFLQIARFARCGSLARFEFIYVNNTPELEEVLHRDAELAAALFETSVSVVSLNQNTGFSHANNVGIGRARAPTVVVINPDVFPYEKASLSALVRLASGRPSGGVSGRARHAITGGKLFYADGSVMHEGMYFVADPRLSALARTRVWTVEHLRKGFPDRGDRATMPVPAVSGALMVFDRAECEALGGFDERFVYGHYEDADLCLRFAARGWKVLYDAALSFWHYEGSGSIKRPEHAGALHFNRWHFSRKWQARLPERG